jgi:hypothetical protein
MAAITSPPGAEGGGGEQGLDPPHGIAPPNDSVYVLVAVNSLIDAIIAH